MGLQADRPVGSSPAGRRAGRFSRVWIAIARKPCEDHRAHTSVGRIVYTWMVERSAVRPRGAGTRGRSARGNAMPNRPFVHLHCHSHYSLLDGASKIPALVKRAKALGMPALAVTDHGNLYGAIEFLREAKAADSRRSSGSRLRRARTAERADDGRGLGQRALVPPDAPGRKPRGSATCSASRPCPSWRGSTTSPGSTRKSSSATPRASSASRAAPRRSTRTTSCTARRPRPSGGGRLVSEGLRRGELLRRSDRPGL